MSGFYPGLSPAGNDPRAVAAVVNSLRDGKVNSTGDVTLTAATTTTAVTDARCALTSAVILVPASANAAAEAAWVTVADKAFTVTHASASTTDRTFRYVILG